MSSTLPDRKSVRSTDSIDLLIGKNLRLIRLSQNFSQEQLSKRVAVTFQQIQKYEKGKNRLSVSRMVQLAAVLDCHPMDFLKGVWDGACEEHRVWQQIMRVTDHRILHAFQAIACPKQQEKVLALVKTLAGAED